MGRHFLPVTLLLILLSSGASAEVVVVHQADMMSWSIQPQGAGLAQLVAGPGSPPLGDGSFRLVSGPNGTTDGVAVSTTRFSGTPVADLTALRFSTLVTAHANPNAAPNLFLLVDPDGAGPGGSEGLIVAPIYVGYASGLDIWQEWNVIDAPNAFYLQLQGEANRFSLQEYVASNPGAELQALALFAGPGPPGAWEDFDGNVDRVVVGVNGNNTVFNFQPAPPATTVVRVFEYDPKGWSFQPQGRGVGDFVEGPGPPPFGRGSARLVTGPDGTADGVALVTDQHAGTRLADLSALRFSTWVTARPPGHTAPNLFLFVDPDAAGPASSEGLILHPVYVGYTGTLSTWQEWDVLEAPNAFYTLAQGEHARFSIAEYVASNPDAELLSVAAFAGPGPAGAWEDFDGNVDGLVVGVGGNTAVYDFDALEAVPALRTPSLLFLASLALAGGAWALGVRGSASRTVRRPLC